MGKIMVVVSYDTPEGVAYDGTAIEVANKLRPLFHGRETFEVHLAQGQTANFILEVLADRTVKRARRS